MTYNVLSGTLSNQPTNLVFFPMTQFNVLRSVHTVIVHSFQWHHPELFSFTLNHHLYRHPSPILFFTACLESTFSTKHFHHGLPTLASYPLDCLRLLQPALWIFYRFCIVLYFTESLYFICIFIIIY